MDALLCHAAARGLVVVPLYVGGKFVKWTAVRRESVR